MTDESENIPLPIDFYKGNDNTTWLSDGIQHFVLVRLKAGVWLQCHIDPTSRPPQVVVNVVEETHRGWKEYVHKKFAGWYVHSCKITGVNVKDDRVHPEDDEE